jgi:CubicO group peptidase (beta-lactamase class C family)
MSELPKESTRVMAKQQLREFEADLATRLNDLVEARVAEKKCPSVSAVMFQGGDELLHAGYGEMRIGAGQPGPQTIYRIASCTKSFTATMLMILRDRGLVNLDAPITDFVPEFTQAPIGRVGEPPSIRMLMSMSGGLPTDDPWADRQESISNEQLRSVVADGVSLTAAPGTGFQYSNLGYALLGQVIEVVTGKQFSEAVIDEILTPLELRDTGFAPVAAKEDQYAHGYRNGTRGWVELGFSAPGAFSCIGGLFSSGRDLSAWVQWFASANDGETSGTGPLSVASRREMQQIVTVITQHHELVGLRSDPSRTYGYGYGLFSEYDERYGQFVSHSGGYPGFSSHMRWHTPTGLGVVVLENATYSGAWGTATQLMDEVLEDLDYRLPLVDVWPVTLERANLANLLIRKWDDEVAAQVFEENVGLDVPYQERRSQIEKLVDELGGLAESSEMTLHVDKSDSPLHLLWTVPAMKGVLSCEIRLSPKTPSLIQTFEVRRGRV